MLPKRGCDPGRGGCEPRGGCVPGRGGFDPGRGVYIGGGFEPWRGWRSDGDGGDEVRAGGTLPVAFPGGRDARPAAAWKPGRLARSDGGAVLPPGLGPGGSELGGALVLVAPTWLPGGGWNGTGVAIGR